jgi:hypothetical protein
MLVNACYVLLIHLIFTIKTVYNNDGNLQRN